ncbi:hypothetical protein QTP88_000024 [Uroleucon formosanum]
MQYTNQAASFLTEINSNKNHVIKIVEQPKSYNTRSRRGLINMVGRVANVLFGVCDDTDAKYFHDKIKELERSKSQLFQITETQTQIMKSILTNVNSSLIELEKKQGSLVDGYNHLLHKTDVIEMDVGILKFQNALTERIALLNVILTQYAYETENLVSIVNSALLGHIHPSLLDASEFNQQLKQIKIQLPIGLGLPIDLAEKGISELLRIVEISVVYVKGILMFIMEIPLIDNYDFMLYKSIPLPVKVRSALYSPPHHNISNATFTDYFNTIKNNFIIGGDYNAKHNAWGCRTNNPRGIVLYNFVNANNFNVLAPPGPTYWPSSPAKNPDILDIFETKIPSNLHCLTKNILELNSDHSSVILNVSATVFARVEPPRLFSPLTDRLEFQNIINQRIDLKIKLKSNYDIDEAVNNLTMLIQSATWEATKPNKTHDSKNNYPIVSDQIRCLIVEKRRARAKYQVTRLPSHKTAYNKLANLLKKVLAKYKSFIMNPPAKSSLSPSHIKNTKNNLTIHPIKIVKSNDNTNNWQTVPMRSPSTPTSPNPIIQKTNSFSSKNRFSALATNEISYEISNEVEMLSQEISNVQPKIPPIYIKDDIDFFDFCKKIKPFTDPDGFNTKSSSSGLKLMTYSINAYRQIIKFLEINNMNFHTYQTNEEKAFRVVIRHLHHTTPTDYIKEELHSLGFITRSITNCLQYKTKNPLPLFFVDLEPSPSNHNIYKVDSICYTKIKIEAPHPKKNPVQRLRCQNYGHTRTYCHHTPRCVKRCDIHLSFECQKDSNTPATCALCSGDHPASYKGCPKFKLLQKERSSIKTNRPTET